MIKTKQGYNILHHSSANNYYDLSVKALKSQPQLVYSRDNYGRTPIFWAVWKGSWEIALLLIANKSRIDEQDEVGDTILHIAAQKNKSEEIKKILFYVLKNDNEVKSNTRVVLKLLQTKNNNGFLPTDIATELEDDVMINVLKGIEQTCTEIIEEVEKFVFIQDISMRSGKFNGKKLSKIDPNLMGSKFEFLEEGILLQFNKKDGRTLRVEMEYKNFAFLILEKEQLKVEITLSNSPYVRIQNEGLWKESKQNLFTDSLSFHCHLFREKDLMKIQKIIEETKVLSEFEELCYCFKNSSVQTKKNEDLIEVKVDMNTVNKLSVLRKKFNEMNFLDKSVETNEDSEKIKNIVN
jgi:hypothetical protein